MMSESTVLGVGELLWDIFPTGACLGGAPTNVACHASQLGATAKLVSCVGDDSLGRQAIESLHDKGVDTSGVELVDLPTGTVQVELDARGKPSYTIVEHVAWDEIAWTPTLEELATTADAVCFGTLGQRCETSRNTIRRFLSAVPASALKVVDLNLRPPFDDDLTILDSLELANVVKLSDEELPRVARLCDLRGEPIEQLVQLSKQFDLQLTALTAGGHGAWLCRGDEVAQQPAPQVEVVDTVGAGDSFTAALVLGLLKKASLEAIARFATAVGAYVCTQAGATPLLPVELIDRLSSE